jgi:starvation-inducible DNA-binding protein
MVTTNGERTAVDVGLKPEASEQVSQLLNVYLSDLHVLYGKLHNFHWNVEGESFFSLHETLESEYKAIAEEIDEVAERVLKIGHRPLSGLTQYTKAARLQDAETKGYSGQEIAEALLADYKVIIDELRHLIRTAGEYDDEGTADDATAWLKAKEKSVWMFTAYSRG